MRMSALLPALVAASMGVPVAVDREHDELPRKKTGADRAREREANKRKQQESIPPPAKMSRQQRRWRERRGLPT